MYLSFDSAFAVTSESFGQQRPAAWPLNLHTDPNATVQIGKRIVRCRARRASDEELDELWPKSLRSGPRMRQSLPQRVRHTFILEPPADVETDR